MSGHKGHLTALAKKVTNELETTAKDRLSRHIIEKYSEDLERHNSIYVEIFEDLEEVTEADNTQWEAFEDHYNDTKAKVIELQQQLAMMGNVLALERSISSAEKAGDLEAGSMYHDHHKQWLNTSEKLLSILSTPGGLNRDFFEKASDNFRTRVAKLTAKHNPRLPPRAPSSATTPATTPVPSRSTIKTKTLPVPEFDGTMDQYRHWVDDITAYFTRLPDATDQEKAIYLLEAVKDDEGEAIIREGQRARVGHDEIMRRLGQTYDKPRTVMATAAAALFSTQTAEHTGKGIRSFRSTLRRHIDTIRDYGDNSLDQFFTIIATNCMDEWMRQKWFDHMSAVKKVPGFPELEDFLLKLSDQYDRPDTGYPSTKPTTGNRKPAAPNVRASQPQRAATSYPRPSSTPVQSSGREEEKRCPACSGTCQKLYRCDKFRGLTTSQRKEMVQEAHICFNCLSPGHSARLCTSKFKCSSCGGRHNSLLHDDSRNKSTCSVMAPQPQERYSIRRTSRVRVAGQGTSLTLMALHDGGSEVTLIEKKAVKRLHLKTWPVHLDLKMITTPAVCTEAVQLKLSSHLTRNQQEIEVLAYVVDDLGQVSPNRDISKAPGMLDFKMLPLANPNFCVPEHIDVLLGVDTEAEVCLGHTFTSPNSTLVARSTIFGYTVGGVVPQQKKTITTTLSNVAAVTVEEPLLDLNRFWQDEEPPPTSKPVLTAGEEAAVKQFNESITKIGERYQVALPRKQPELVLGASRPQAYTRLLQNQRSLIKKGTWGKFQEALRDYEVKDHAEPVPPHQLQRQAYYLPTHGVTKDSTTTKLRVVFDASAKTTNCKALNDLLWPGPATYPLLSNILIRFRRHTIALTADISQMFREIQLAPGDRDLHRYLAFNEEGQVVDMRMKRLTFGVTSSPFLATQTLRQNATDNKHQFPEAAEIVFQDFYVDDCLTGADTVEEAVHLSQQLCQLTAKGSMTLRKWRSNSPQVLDHIPDQLRETEREAPLVTATNGHLKALGIHWDVSTDSLSVATPTLKSSDPATKRQVASDVARTFDVLGLFAPYTLQLKLLIQELWTLGLSWDEPLPARLIQTWKDWRSGLDTVNQHPIPRMYSQEDHSTAKVTIHGFCDASLKAYAAVLYLRVEGQDGRVTASLMFCKSKVAPTTSSTIPRLELRAAVLLTELISTTCVTLKIPYHDVRAWSDSSSVLHWIRASSHRHKPFVANRIHKIQELLPAVLWLYVPTACNPADVASRGCTAAELVSKDLWWHGPAWLNLHCSDWPDQTVVSLPPASELELKSCAVRICAVQEETSLDLLKRYSDYRKLLRVVAMIMRFVCNSRASKAKNPLNKADYILPKELQLAEETLWRTHQLHRWPNEVKALQAGKPVARTSHLFNLRPIIKNGLMRIGGRLENSQLAYSRKHPVILAGKSTLALLLIRHLHISNYHAGPSTMIALLSLRAHVIGSKAIIRQVSRRCVACQRVYANTTPQMMADLPACRTTPSPPFLHTGVDYAGPIPVKLGPLKRPQKVSAYIALFICMATKAVHIELVWDTTAASFLSLLRRFIARRGLPKHLWSDNGGNFTGCHRILDELHQKLSDCTPELARFCAERQITWHYSPANGPHFGGLWEAGVKSAKRVLHKVVGHHTLRMEDMTTVLAEIEAILNSRPLCQPSSQPEDGVMVLTPGHFLVGRPLMALPDYFIPEAPSACRDRFRLNALLAQHFWQRWSGEYLTILQRRHKWLHPQTNIKVGDVVLMTKEDSYLKHWPLGLVTEAHPGADGLVRSVMLRTANSKAISRPTHRLVRLVYEDDFDDWDALAPHPDDDQTSPSLPGGEDVQGPDT